MFVGVCSSWLLTKGGELVGGARLVILGNSLTEEITQETEIGQMYSILHGIFVCSIANDHRIG